MPNGAKVERSRERQGSEIVSNNWLAGLKSAWTIKPTLRSRPGQLLHKRLAHLNRLTKALVPAIHMSATYLRDADNGYPPGYVYGRTDNLSVQQAENLIAELERAEEALVFGSGMAAATSVLLALEKPTHVIASQVMYWGFRSWLREIGRYGHSVTFVDTSDLDAIRDAVRPGETGLFWIETPSNPLWTITDICRRFRDRPQRGRHIVRRFDGGHSDLHSASLPRRRPRHALRHQVSQRAFRRDRRRPCHRRARANCGLVFARCVNNSAARLALSTHGC